MDTRHVAADVTIIENRGGATRVPPYFSFNMRNGINTLSTESMLCYGFIYLWCVGFGVASAQLTLD